MAHAVAAPPLRPSSERGVANAFLAEVVVLKRNPRAVIPVASPLSFSDEDEFRWSRRQWEDGVKRDADLLPTHRLVLLHFGSFAGWNSFPFPSNATVAEDLGISRETVKRAMSEGRRLGWVIRRRRRGFRGTMEYALGWIPGRKGAIDEKAEQQARRRKTIRGGP